MEIKEFPLIVQRRAKERDEAEDRLFKKILDCLKAKNLEIEEFFNLLDKDGNKEVSTAEFKEGLYNLKIILN